MDRIRNNGPLRAPRARGWRALRDSAEFGSWFGVKFDGPFTSGACLGGVVAPMIERHMAYAR